MKEKFTRGWGSFAIFTATLAIVTQEDIPTEVTPIEPTPITIAGVIINIINFVLAFAAALAVLFIIIGGVRFIISAGNEEAASNAKKIILYAILGLLVILLSFVIVGFVENGLAPIITQ